MIIDCAHYQDGRRRDEGAVPLEEAAARCGQGGFVWLGLFEPSDEELAQVRDTFGLHELAVEDAQNFHMRPKTELYDPDVRLVILRTARYDDAAEEVQFGEISVFLAPAFVIAVRQGVASELRGARQRLEQRPELLAAGSSSALWAILDQVVDDYAPVVAGLERDIDQIEATVFSGAVAPTERIYSLRRVATNFYRAVHPLLAVLSTVERATEAPQLEPYLRDVHDHLLLVNEEAAGQRDLLGTVLEANMAVISVEQTKVSVRQNTTMEQLTILATIFLPLTFITGFFGQNFAWLVRHISGYPAFILYGLGGLIVPLALLYLWLRRGTPRANTAPARGNLPEPAPARSEPDHVASGRGSFGQGLHERFECGGPAFPVGTAGFGGDGCDELLPERFPVAAERMLDDRGCQREHGALPGCVESQLAVAAGQVQVGKAQRGAHSRATPIIESRVTRPASSTSVIPPVPGGRWGKTR
jgi:magnesium transporter